MKALVKTGKSVGFSCLDVAVPVPGPGDVRIKVNATGICGSDIHTYLWDAYAEGIASRLGVSFPFVAGHEYAGTIDEVAPDVQGFEPGDRVAMETHVFCGKCFHCLNGMAHNCPSTGWYGFGYGGSFAEYCIAPARILFKLPDQVSFEEAAIFEPAGVAVRAVEESHVAPGDTVVVLGAGPIGLMAIQILNACGAARVIAVDVVDYRLSIAETYGAIPLNPTKVDVAAEVKRITSARQGADVVLEMTGSPKVYPTMFEILRNEGRIVTVGHPGEVPINVTQWINLKGVSIKGVFGRRIWQTWWKLASLVESGKLDLSGILTHRFELNESEEAFAQMKSGAGKVLFIPKA